jgi:hypothetical protein
MRKSIREEFPAKFDISPGIWLKKSERKEHSLSKSIVQLIRGFSSDYETTFFSPVGGLFFSGLECCRNQLLAF